MPDCAGRFRHGYSSLAYITRFHPNGSKIDKAFVNNVDRSASDGAVANAILSLGKSLDLIVTAEGIERNGSIGVAACARLQRGTGLPAIEALIRPRSWRIGICSPRRRRSRRYSFRDGELRSGRALEWRVAFNLCLSRSRNGAWRVNGLLDYADTAF